MKMKTGFTVAALLCLGAIQQASASQPGPSYDDYADEQGTVVTYQGEQYIRVTDARQFLRSIISGQNLLVAADTEINSVDFTGVKPTIVDFVNTAAKYRYGSDCECDDECDSWKGDWQRYQRTGQAERGVTVTVDQRSGYARIETRNGKLTEYQDFCFWNCADGKHKIFARGSGVLDGGKEISPEQGKAYLATLPTFDAITPLNPTFHPAP